MSGAPSRKTDFSWHPLADGNPPAWASGWGQDEQGVFVEFTLDQVTQRLRWIPPGEFTMGSPEDEPGRSDDEGPKHEVIIATGYWLFDTPVTQALWQAVMGQENNPSRFVSPERPVEQVSWDDSRKFIAGLSEIKPGLQLSLPSEAQWEYACRAGTETALYTGDIEILGDANAPALNAIAWYGGNSGEEFELENGHEIGYLSDRQFDGNPSGTHPVGRKRSNPWGLYDMLGNVWEWVQDSRHASYEGAPQDGSAWVDGEAAAERVFRGGSWDNKARLCRSAARNWSPPGNRSSNLGFRCARVQA